MKEERVLVLRLIREDLYGLYGAPCSFCQALNTLWLNPAFQAVCLYRMAYALQQRRLVLLARLLCYISRCALGVEITTQAKIGRRFRLIHGSGVVIGLGAVLGDDCTVYQGVTLGLGRSGKQGQEYPEIGDGVIIYAGAKVLGGVTVGAHSVIGANAVVTTDLPAHCVAAGVPARIIRLHGQRVTANSSPDGASLSEPAAHVTAD
jgi:serine O-acetyltransferase